MVLKAVPTSAVDIDGSHALDQLRAVLQRCPCIRVMGAGRHSDGNWWVRMSIDVRHLLVWDVVREFGCVMDYLSPERPWRAVFMPAFHAPGTQGERDAATWILCSQDPALSPVAVARWLEICLPLRNRIKSHAEPVGAAVP